MSYITAMNRTRLSSKGQVVLPKSIRDALHLEEGTEFVVSTEGNAVVLRRSTVFPPTTLAEVTGYLKTPGPSRTLAEMEQGLRRAHRRRANTDDGLKPRPTRRRPS